MLSIGPFSADIVVVALALAAALGIGALSARRHASGAISQLLALITDMALIGIVAARLGFVLRWWPQYMHHPWSIVYISDGGFLIWTGAVAAALFAAWRVRKTSVLWRPLAVAVVAGWVVWIAAGAVLSVVQRSQVGMPEVALTRLDGSSVRLTQLTGKPMVVNLWATWCPPCRREMPMLERAQRHHPGVTFVFVNQRQGAATVRDFLDDQQLRLDHVLIDSRGAIARRVGSHALPTTLFFAADGRLVNAHVGMLTAASLAATLRQFDLPTNDVISTEPTSEH